MKTTKLIKNCIKVTKKKLLKEKKLLKTNNKEFMI